MNHTRTLRFEVMEPRIALSANATDMLADLQADIAAHGFDPQRAQGILEEFVKSREDSPVSPLTTPPSNEWGDVPVVRFRVDIFDSQDQPVEVVQAGGEYLARVFVQDMRDLTTVNPDDSLNGGVFKAWVDLEFSANLHPTGSVRVNEAFSNRKLDPAMDGSFLRNLGGVASDFTPFGDAEQFLLEAPFVVDSTDTPNRIQVVPSTSQRDPVLLFGSGNAVPNQNITSATFDLLRATNIDSSGNTRPPLLDPFDDLSTKFLPPIPPSTALTNAGDGSYEAASGEDPVALVSYIPFFRDDDPDSHWKSRDEDDWWRSKRGEDERNHIDDWSELDWPDEEGKLLDTKSVNRGDLLSTHDAESDEDETEVDGGKRQSKHAGLFYDEALFLEGALVEPFQSKFRLHLQIFAPPQHAAVGTASKNASTPRDGFIDIAAILTPHQDTKPWQENVDKAVAAHQDSPSPTHHGPAIVWGTIEPLPENTNAHPRVKQAEANQKLPDQRTPLAMNQSVNSSSPPGPTTTVQ